MNGTTEPVVETRTGAVLFTDLVGFTEYTEGEGDVAALGVLEHQTSLMTGVVEHRADARIVKELGDGLMVWFPDPFDGLDGALAMLLAVDAARRADDFPVAIRMGLHVGEVLPRGNDLVGATVNVAARIAALAGPCELLASEVAVHACGERLPPARLDPVGPAPVKGVSEPVWLVRISPDHDVAQ